ncbi:MAG TPA: FAD-binding oxidoreductase [Mycobacteriales bacterium]|nr:FAD-binding oxidoreductase [Mycobacteriales bacterium]
MSRRRALGLLAGTGAAGLLGACSAGGSPTPRPTRSVLPRPTPALPSPAAATVADWSALAGRLRGDLRRAGDAGYDEVARLFDPRFDHIRPAAVASVAAPHDVAHCLDFARRFDLPVSIRSGGHSYVGASTGHGLVIDVRPLHAISVGAGTATIGAGAALVDVYAGLADHGVSIPAGSCPSVGLSGLALGGGVGVVTRRYGLTCDRITAATVVTASGDTMVASPHHHPDLYWALRGGGGSFGVVTDLTLATHPAGALAHAFYVWPWSVAATVVTAWQAFAAHAPRELWSACHVLAPDDKAQPPNVSVPAVYVGSSTSLSSLMQPLLDAVPAAPTTASVRDSSYADTMLLEAGCADLTLAACHVADETGGGQLPRDAFVAGSDFFAHPIPARAVADLVAAVADRAADPRLGAGGVSLDALGGAVDDLAPDATAYVHRGALFNAQYTAGWSGTGNAPLLRNRRSLMAIRATVHRYGTGGAYQNYADGGLHDPQRAYYGDNLPRLIDVKRTYDPTNVFAQPQGIPPNPR